jgi:hypothetical protein
MPQIVQAPLYAGARATSCLISWPNGQRDDGRDGAERGADALAHERPAVVVAQLHGDDVVGSSSTLSRYQAK